jgi:hypothetical protein
MAIQLNRNNFESSNMQLLLMPVNHTTTYCNLNEVALIPASAAGSMTGAGFPRDLDVFAAAYHIHSYSFIGTSEIVLITYHCSGC